MLDETVGPMNWQRRHEVKDGNLYCSVGIRNDDGEWVWKEDVGVPSNMDADKGQASDSFKRACFNWDIGRELYTAPDIWVRADMCNLHNGKNGKLQCHDRFKVSDMTVENGKITSIEIVNESMKNRKVFSWPQKQQDSQQDKKLEMPDALKNARKAAYTAITRFSELHNGNPETLWKGIFKRPSFEDTPEYWEQIEMEFLNEC